MGTHPIFESDFDCLTDFLGMSHEAILRHKAGHYPNSNDVIRQVSKLTRQYTELRVDVQRFTHNNGSQENLIKLYGTIPVFYKQRQYNIPIVIWLLEKHPTYAPLVFVHPTSTMVIRQGRHVDAGGKVYLPYLSDWKSKKSDLVGLAGILCTVFGNEPPVVAKPAGAPTSQPPARTNTGYPTQPSYPAQPPSYPSASNVPYPTGGGGYSHNVQGPPSGGYQPPTQTPYPAGNFPSHPPTSVANPPPYPAPNAYAGYQQHNQNLYGRDQSDSGISDDIIVASLRDAVNDSCKRRANAVITQLNTELTTLRTTEQELNRGKEKLSQMNSALEQEKETCNNSIQQYQSQLNEINAELNSLESGDKICPSDIITPSAPLYKQIFNSHAQEMAIEDAIYFITKALSRGTIDCDTFLRYTRRLARQQFEMKETVIRAREVARL